MSYLFGSQSVRKAIGNPQEQCENQIATHKGRSILGHIYMVPIVGIATAGGKKWTEIHFIHIHKGMTVAAPFAQALFCSTPQI